MILNVVWIVVECLKDTLETFFILYSIEIHLNSNFQSNGM